MNLILLQMDDPAVVSNKAYAHAVASPRLRREEPDTLPATGTLGCSITWIPEDRFDENNPLDLSWRGGAATIADVILS
uniref:Uncharacterized protein n=1 Tax=Candidatus Kentrum sp. UNK TaxID=2126344 RepID=A0A451AKM1_9GAMM|nr:MAG: hypothetical protein BECKUNK1418G_GA0071005_109910 [Candidatus Kentron sp. UNK]VFK69918.1 MAG: hypothetical protein BECKUNK1418H_GA0071006_102110 [Candidatus Kentron sp. UNK]